MSAHFEEEYITDPEGNTHKVQAWQNDTEAGKLGFWLFMFTEIMMFGAMFLSLLYYYSLHEVEFLTASHSLNRVLGGINTVILLISALTMGLGLVKMKKGDIKNAKLMIWATIILATAFLVVKGFEWSAEYHHGIFLGLEKLQAGTESYIGHGQTLFFGMYFTMTGLHGFHIILGIGVMLWLLKRINSGKVNQDHYILHFNITLYWDLVHLIWVFVFPLYYMIGAGMTVVGGGH